MLELYKLFVEYYMPPIVGTLCMNNITPSEVARPTYT